MASSSALPIISGGLSISTPHSSFSNHQSATVFKWGLRRDQDAKLVTRRTKGQAFRVLANPNGNHVLRVNKSEAPFLDVPSMVSPSKAAKKEVIMVDPLEAKKLAAKQMAKLKAEERLKDFVIIGPTKIFKETVIAEAKRRREIEAINGAWAMIGLTTGLVIEGHTGNSILSQLAGYWAAIVHFFVR